LALSVHKPRSLSISSSESNKEYHIRVKRDSDRMDEDDPVSPIGNSQVLRLKPLVLDRRRTLYRVYTRELDKELCTGLFTLYTNT